MTFFVLFNPRIIQLDMEGLQLKYSGTEKLKMYSLYLDIVRETCAEGDKRDIERSQSLQIILKRYFLI